MDYFAGLDISMDETHVCVVDREGVVVHQSKTASTAAAIAVELAKAPSCRRIVFETGRMAPIWAWSPGGISRARSTTSAAYRNAVTGGCEPSCTRPPTSC